MKPLLIVTSAALITLSLGLASAKSSLLFSDSLLIQSLESKTLFEEPVINEIKWFSFKDKDVWMMNQSHFGVNATADQKDRLAIVIDKTRPLKTAYFMQLIPGPLIWLEQLYAQKIKNKVSCFMCHANGLRAIRPDLNGLIKTTFLQKLKLNYLNFKIKSYGIIAENNLHKIEDLSLSNPFRYRTKFENKSLTLQACTRCHDGEKRSQLTRQNAIAIQFLVKNNFMPPDKNGLSKNEIKLIQNFTDGF